MGLNPFDATPISTYTDLLNLNVGFVSLEQMMTVSTIRPLKKTSPGPLVTVPENQDAEYEPFPFGWRTVEEIGPNGEVIYRDVALTLPDFLDPQLGDQMPQGHLHQTISADLYNQFKHFFEEQPDVRVFSDVKLLWNIPGLPEPFPDLFVVRGVQPEIDIVGSFDCMAHGVKPCLIIEVMSPRYEKGDRLKVDIYQQAGIEEYITINPRAKQRQRSFELTGYRLRRGRYHPINPTAEGQLLSQTTGVLMGLSGPAQRNIELRDAATGKLLPDYQREKQARLIAESRANYEIKRANHEAERADQAKAQLRQTVINMLAKGLAIELIQELTGLPLNEIEQMRVE